MALILKALGGVTALTLLAIALFTQLITLGGLLLAAIKVGIVITFLAITGMIVFSILRDRSRRRHEVDDI